MATNTKTLDQRIREKARKQLMKEIDSAFAQAGRMIGGTGYQIKLSGYSRDEGKPAYANECLRAIKDAAFATLSTAAEEKAIAAFIDEVDSLQDRLHDMRHEIINN